MNETKHNLQIEISRRHELERDKLRNYEVRQYEYNKEVSTTIHVELRGKEENNSLKSIIKKED
jgi:hypothetical protein